MQRPFPPGPVSERALKRQKFRKYHWFRHHNRDSDDPKWGAVAAAASASVAEVIATVNKLQEVANEGFPRGSLDDFEFRDWAYVLRVDPEVVHRIYAQLEACLWIDQGRIPVFELRNPDQEDPTSTERVRAHRARKNEAKTAAKQAGLLAATGGTETVKRVSSVSFVTETTRAEQIINQERRLPLGPVVLRSRT